MKSRLVLIAIAALLVLLALTALIFLQSDEFDYQNYLVNGAGWVVYYTESPLEDEVPIFDNVAIATLSFDDNQRSFRLSNVNEEVVSQAAGLAINGNITALLSQGLRSASYEFSPTSEMVVGMGQFDCASLGGLPAGTLLGELEITEVVSDQLFLAGFGETYQLVLTRQEPIELELELVRPSMIEFSNVTIVRRCSG